MLERVLQKTTRVNLDSKQGLHRVREPVRDILQTE